MMQIVQDHLAHETLILNAIVAVCGVDGSVRGRLLEEFADMLVKLNHPPIMKSPLMQDRQSGVLQQQMQEQMQAATQNGRFV